jgi:magnesium transporter
MIQTLLFRESKEPTSVEPEAWPSLSEDDANLLWVDLEDPSKAEVARVAQEFGFDPRGVAIVEQSNRRPLVRVYRDHFLVTVQSVAVEGHPAPRIEVLEVDSFVARNVLVTIHKRPLPFADELSARTATNPQLFSFSGPHLLHILLDALLDEYSRELDELEGWSEQLEDRLLRARGRRALEEVAQTKRQIRVLRRVLAPHSTALSTLIAPDSPMQAMEGVDIEPFRDLLFRLDGLLQRLDHARDVASASYDLYMSNMSFRTNQQLKVLTFLSAVLLPMTVLVGLFGTNFKLAEYDAWEPFYVMLAGMALIAAAMLLYFWRKRWL